MKWLDKNDTKIELIHGPNIIATLRQLPYPPFDWVLNFDNRVKLYSKDTPEMLKYMATSYINNCCNDIISNYEWIQNNLPDWHELAEKAGIFGEME